MRRVTRPGGRKIWVRGASTLLAAGVGIVMLATPAAAHSYAATVYATLTEPSPGLIRTVLDLEYELLATDGAQKVGDAGFESAAAADIQATRDDPAQLTPQALEAHSATVLAYVLPRFSIAAAGGSDTSACPSALVEPYAIALYEGVPHARMVIETDCRDRVKSAPATYRITTGLFPSTGAGGKTTTIVTYDLDSGSGVASLDTDTDPTMTTAQDWGSRMGEFFVLGATHLLSGIDHLLFLFALIVASRRLRDIVMVASAFTVAHSVTFILAALGVVSVPAIIVEPLIALSIAVVALWYLWGQWRQHRDASDASVLPPAAALVPTQGRLTVGDWLRVGVVFVFGLVHGVGFAGALGINEQFSWGLLGALLVFNLGIEVVQLTIIVVVFPLLVLLRRHAARVAGWVATIVSAAVALIGLTWFGLRLFGL